MSVRAAAAVLYQVLMYHPVEPVQQQQEKQQCLVELVNGVPGQCTASQRRLCVVSLLKCPTCLLLLLAACKSSPESTSVCPLPRAILLHTFQRPFVLPVLSSWPPRASNPLRPACPLLHSGAAPPAAAAAPPPPYDDTATLRHTRSTTPFNVQPNPVRLNHQPSPSSTQPAPSPVSRNTSPALEAPRYPPKRLGSHVNTSCGLGAAHAGWRTGASRTKTTTTARKLYHNTTLRGAFLCRTHTICVE